MSGGFSGASGEGPGLCSWAWPNVEEQVLYPLKGGRWRNCATFKQEPVLFRAFIEVEPTPEGYLAFANTHGALTMFDSECPGYEPVGLRGGSQLWLRHLTTIWECLQRGEGAALDVLIDRAGGFLAVRGAEEAAAGCPLAPSADDWGWFPVIKTPGSILSAYLQHNLTHAIRKGADVYLTTNLAGEPGQTGIELSATNLLAAMAVQLFLAVVGDAKHRRRVVCTRWFEETRADKVICSPACKTRLSRERKAKQ